MRLERSKHVYLHSDKLCGYLQMLIRAEMIIAFDEFHIGLHFFRFWICVCQLKLWKIAVDILIFYYYFDLF